MHESNESPVVSIHFDLTDLVAFCAVADLGSFSKAAASVHLSQPAYSRRIDKLEQALGVKLLERTTRRVTLTAVGREFERKARAILDDLDSALLGIRGHAGVRRERISIACVPSSVCYYVSQVLRLHHALYPRVRVTVFDAKANEVLAAVAQGEADFGLSFLGAHESGIDFKPLVEERFVVACRRDHPIATLPQVSWAQLAPYDFIAVARTSGNRLLLDQALAGVRVRPEITYETQSGTTLLGLVEAGLGIAAVPAMAMPGPDHPLLAAIALVEPSVTRKMGLISRRGRRLSPSAQQLFELFDTVAPTRP